MNEPSEKEKVIVASIGYIGIQMAVIAGLPHPGMMGRSFAKGFFTAAMIERQSPGWLEGILVDCPGFFELVGGQAETGEFIRSTVDEARRSV